MKVSARVITYNQAPFVARALDSAIEQRVEGEYEVVVGDDGSTDGTREILLDYQRRHPGRVRVLLADANRGGRWNFVRTLQACRGEYVALLDGDDYWTAPDKLARQIAFLERRPDHAICFHDVLVAYEDGRRAPHRYCDTDLPESSTLDDLLISNFIPTCSAMLRRQPWEFPDWFHRAPAGDTPLFILAARRGRIGYLNEVLGVYRVHGRSMTLTRSADGYFKGAATMFACVSQLLGPAYHGAIRARVTRLFVNTFFSPERADREWRWLAPRHIPRALESWPSEFPLSERERRRVLAEICRRVGAACVRAGDASQARAWLRHAARYEPASVTRAAFLSMGVETALGRRAAEAMRKALRAAWHPGQARRKRV